MAYDLGVDLGTTFTAAAVIRDGRVSACRLGGTLDVVPSVVSIRVDGEVLTGEAAERRSLTDPSRTAREFKRRFGDTTPYVLGGAPYGADMLTSFMLRDVIAQVTAAEGEAPRRVALAHPANWGPFKLDLLREAAVLAGVFNVVLVAEPVAAAIEYSARVITPALGPWLVYDFGGGTFDAALVTIARHKAEIHAEVIGEPDGISRLGGIDFDQVVLAFVDTAVGGAVTNLDPSEPEAHAGLSRLRQDCREAKEALSADNEVEIPVILPNVRTSVRLTRIEFETAIRLRVTETNTVVGRILGGANLSAASLAGVLLVGGTSRIPLVVQLVRDFTGKIPATDVDPLLAIASGAARLANDHSSIAVGSEAVADQAVVVVGRAMHSRVTPGRAKAGVAMLLAAAAAVGVIVWAMQSRDDAGGAQSSTTTPRGNAVTTSSGSTVTSSPRTTDLTNGPQVTVSSSSQPPVRSSTATSTTVAAVGPRFASVSLPPKISCVNKAPTDRVDVQVAWNAVETDSVSVALDNTFQIWESNLPAQGSTTYSVPCDGSKVQSVVYVTAKRAGLPDKTQTQTLQIVFS